MAKTTNRGPAPGGTSLDRAAPGRSPAQSPLVSRAAFLIASFALLLGIILYYARDRWLAVIGVAVVEIPMVAGWVVSAWLLGKPILRLFVGRDKSKRPASRALLFATAAGMGLGLIGLVALGLGLAGLLNRWTALAILLVGPAMHLRQAIAFFRANRQVAVGPWLREPVGAKWILLAAGPAIAIMITGASITPGLLWKPDDPHPYDVMEYHLQVPREWYDGGRIVGLHHNVYSYFPYGVEMHYLLAMHLRGGPYAAMYQCQYLSMAWLILTALAVYGTAFQLLRDPSEQSSGEEGPPQGWRVLLAGAAAVLVLATPWVTMLGAVAYTEGALALYTCLAAAWILVPLNASDEAGRIRSAALAGALAGLACGVKYTAFPMVLVAIPVVMTIFAVATRSLRRCWGAILAFALAGGVVASPWLIRNFAWTGNPVFPLALKQLGPGHFDPVQVQRFEVAHAAPAALRPIGARCGQAIREIFANWQYGYVIWLLAGIALALAWKRRSAWFCAGLLLLVLIVWIGFTHLLGRFYVLMIPVAAMLIVHVRDRRWAGIVAAAAICAAAMGWSQVHPRFERFTQLAQAGAFGLEDVSILIPGDLTDLKTPGTTVWMIGDAQAFFYPIPSSHMHYRTVFDLPGNAPDMYQAWLGVPWSQAPAGLIVIQPVEVERLAATYRDVPGLPRDFAGPRDTATVIKR